jgi:H+/Cl- antiporter ClcA
VRYGKPVAVGLLTALLAVVILIAASINASFGEGSSTITISVEESWMLAAALLGFAIGFGWMVRRRRRRRSRGSPPSGT